MSGIFLLSGTELLRKGLEKGERVLPVKGEKAVAPSGAWVQQTQIQLALDERRQLIADERVEKWGTLSHAEWEEEQGLARVTEIRGGHWAYLGHHRSNQLYIFPEEALYLMEVNCLHLTFKGVQVSLQQAYSLLLTGKITALEYKVYSQLSRVGYRVLRSTIKNADSLQEQSDIPKIGVDTANLKAENVEDNMDSTECDETTDSKESNEQLENGFNEQIRDDNETSKHFEDIESNESSKTVDYTPDNFTVDDNNKDINVKNSEDQKAGCNHISLVNNSNQEDVMNTGSEIRIMDSNKSVNCIEKELGFNYETSQSSNEIKNAFDNYEICVETESTEENSNWRQLPIIMVMGPRPAAENTQTGHPPNDQSLATLTPNRRPQQSHAFIRGYTRRSSRSLSSLELPDYFKEISNIVGEDTVRIMAPNENFLPRNVFLNRTEYLLKIENIISKQSSTQSETPDRGISRSRMHNRNTPHGSAHPDPMMEAIIRNQFLRSTFGNQHQPPPFMPFPFFMFPNRRFHRFGPRNNAFRYAYNMFAHQRSFYPNRFNMPFQNCNMIGSEDVINLTEEVSVGSRKRMHEDNSKKMDHLKSIRFLTCRLKKIYKNSHGANWEHRNSLKKLVEAYNVRYNENLQIADNLTILNDCEDGETIDLEEEERLFGKRKRQTAPEKSGTDKNNFLQSIKQLAARLKQLRESGEHCFRNRRSLLEAIKVYNQKFDESVYLTSEFNINDSQQIVLDSSSDSDCVVSEQGFDEIPRSAKTGHANPFRRSNKIHLEPLPSTSKDDLVHNLRNRGSLSIQDFYNKHAGMFIKWLPSIEDWGHPEVVPTFLCKNRIINAHQEEYLFNYFNRYKSFEYRDWYQLKSEFWDTLEENQTEANEREDEPPQSLKEVRPCSIEPLLSPDDCSDVVTALKKIRIIKTHTHQDEEVETTLSVTFDVYERDVKNFRKTDPPTPAFRLICVDERNPVPDVCEAVSLLARHPEPVPLVVAAVGIGVSYMQLEVSDLPVYHRKRFL